jgi:hypothetical protein
MRLPVVVAVIVFGLGVGAAFGGGMALGHEKKDSSGPIDVSALSTDQIQQLMSQLRTRQGTASRSGTPSAGGFAGRGTMGQVQQSEPGKLTLTGVSGSVIVNVSADTKYQRQATTEVSLADIKQGDTVSVTGERASDGSVKATTVTIMPEGAVSPGAGEQPPQPQG